MNGTNRLFIKKDYVRNIFTTFSVDVRQNCKPGILLPIYFLGIKTHAKRDTTNTKKVRKKATIFSLTFNQF